MLTGTLKNLVGRKFAVKLKNQLSEKIASELILNEEMEKDGIKKLVKRKKNKKKKTKTTEPSELSSAVCNKL